MTQPPTLFWPIFAAKSDGHDVVNQKGRVVRNGPTQEQLDRTPNEQGQCDFYRLIDKDDPKHVDWRKKLGGMLLREMGGAQHADKWQQTILWEFPENYRLYEHIKTKTDGHARLAKNHSGGGHDRQDAYLYGYPKGPRKRYRSPADFFPHLLWLCTDDDSDYQNCTCKMCSPVQLDLERAPARSEPPAVVKREPLRNPIVLIPAPARRSISGPAAQSPAARAVTPAAPTPTIRVPAALQSTPLPQPRGTEQLTDSRYGLFVCRVGEVVWFLRTTSAWGLGLVTRRWNASATGGKGYLVQPMSYPFDSAGPELVSSDEHIKPWLAWSAPACTFAYLQQNPHLKYGDAPWAELLNGKYGDGIANVDASIMAAKAIDNTYTLYERVKTAPIAGGEDRHYNGIYLGAEKIWRGDPVRISSNGTDLLVVTDIIERVATTAQQQPAEPQVCMVGDVYSYSTLPVADPSKPPTPPSEQNHNIPIRMREDMAWRNLSLVPRTKTLGWWRLIAANSRVGIPDVKGRWYETSLLFVESFTKAVKDNEGGNGIWMNARGDANGIGRTAGLSRPDRIAAFGRALLKGTQLVEGLDPLAQPVAEQSQQQPAHEISGAEPFSLDDFMNVEHLDDAGVDFGHGFPF
jgi:hypothetical protein